MSNFQIRFAKTRAEMDAVMDCQWAAFAHEDLMRAIYAYDPSDPSTLNPAITFSKNAVWEQHKDDSISTWLYVVDTSKPNFDHSGPFIVGSAQWRIYKDNPWPNGSALPKPGVYPAGSAKQKFVGKWLRAAMASRVQYMNRPHLALGWLGVRPEYRRLGVANLMTSWGTSKADEMGFEAALSASSDGQLVYIKHGFVEISRTTLDLPTLCATEEERAACDSLAETGSWISCTMWRPVQGILPEDYETMLEKRLTVPPSKV